MCRWNVRPAARDVGLPRLSDWIVLPARRDDKHNLPGTRNELLPRKGKPSASSAARELHVPGVWRSDAVLPWLSVRKRFAIRMPSFYVYAVQQGPIMHPMRIRTVRWRVELIAM